MISRTDQANHNRKWVLIYNAFRDNYLFRDNGSTVEVLTSWNSE